jgi:hypothetical protein
VRTSLKNEYKVEKGRGVTQVVKYLPSKRRPRVHEVGEAAVCWSRLKPATELWGKCVGISSASCLLQRLLKIKLVNLQ